MDKLSMKDRLSVFMNYRLEELEKDSKDFYVGQETNNMFVHRNYQGYVDLLRIALEAGFVTQQEYETKLELAISLMWGEYWKEGKEI